MLGVESGGLPVEFPPSCTYDRWAGLIGFAKLITCICISPRKRFSFLPWLLLGRGTREEWGGRIIFTKKFVITLTISSSLLLPNIRRLLLIWIDLSLSLSLWRRSPFSSIRTGTSHCVTPLRLHRQERHCPRCRATSSTMGIARLTRFVVQDN